MTLHSSEGPQPKLRRGRRLLREALHMLLTAVAIYTLFNLAVPPRLVEGSSMEPSFHDQQRLFVSRLEYMLGEPERGDVVVILNPHDPQDNNLIKRVIGLPGEHIIIEQGQVYVNGVPLIEPYIKDFPNYSDDVILAPGQYFVLGDNRRNSHDSHDFGAIRRDSIIGRAWISYWPPQWIGIVPDQLYPEATLASP